MNMLFHSIEMLKIKSETTLFGKQSNSEQHDIIIAHSSREKKQIREFSMSHSLNSYIWFWTHKHRAMKEPWRASTHSICDPQFMTQIQITCKYVQLNDLRKRWLKIVFFSSSFKNDLCLIKQFIITVGTASSLNPQFWRLDYCIDNDKRHEWFRAFIKVPSNNFRFTVARIVMKNVLYHGCNDRCNEVYFFMQCATSNNNIFNACVHMYNRHFLTLSRMHTHTHMRIYLSTQNSGKYMEHTCEIKKYV